MISIFLYDLVWAWTVPFSKPVNRNILKRFFIQSWSRKKTNFVEVYLRFYSWKKKWISVILVSFGASRDFTFLPKRNNDDKLTIPLHDGTVLFMTEPTQKFWKHAIPKRLKVKTARINLTFRKIITDEGKGGDNF